MTATNPTTASDLPHRPNFDFTKRPNSKIGVFFWRRRMWFESTFVLSMLEPWEKILLLTVFALLFFLVFTGIFNYMPHHLVFMRRRAMYYLWGQEGDERLLWQWLGLKASEGGAAAASIVGLHKDL